MDTAELCSKNVRIKCESKSQLLRNAETGKTCCVQRTSGLNVKANHNPCGGGVSPDVRCVQRTSGLNVKANHNVFDEVHSDLEVVFKERPD